MSNLAVIFVTHRREPRFDWFADSLAAQLGEDEPEVIFVDGLHSPERAAELEQTVRDRFAFRHVRAKPTPWNGTHRLTRRDLFAAASARNTGIVHTTAPYLVFVDDCAVLMPGWWQQVKTTARHGIVVAGAYRKEHAMAVRDGMLVDSDASRSDLDVRWDRGADGLVEIGGGELFGCSFGAPRELLVEVNGLDELCDPIGGEDYHLGIRLEWAGARIFYSRAMLTVESKDSDRGGLRRVGRTAEPDAYMAHLRRFGVEHRSIDGNWDNSHMVLDIAYGTRSPRSVGNYYDLSTLTEAGLEATIEHFPREYWFDGTPLGDL
jgi:glycosyltransferase involved in cell wall biosynthesis